MGTPLLPPVGRSGDFDLSSVTLVPEIALFIRVVCKNCHCLQYASRGNFTTRACHFPGFWEKGGPSEEGSVRKRK